MILNDIIKKIQNAFNKQGNESTNNEINLRDVFSVSGRNNSQEIHVHNYGSHYNGVNQGIFDEIETLINENLSNEAIIRYDNLLIDGSIQLSTEDRHNIMIGKLNCYINTMDDSSALHIIHSINAILHQVEDYFKAKFYYLCSVHYYNTEDFTQAKKYIDNSIEIDSDNIKIVMMHHLLSVTCEDYENVNSSLIDDNNELLKGEEKDKKYILSIMGQIALKLGYYEDAVKYFRMVDSQTTTMKYNIALSLFFVGTGRQHNEIIDKATISHKELIESVEMFSELMIDTDSKLPNKTRDSIIECYFKGLYLLEKKEDFKSEYNRFSILVDGSAEATKIYKFIVAEETGVNQYEDGELPVEEALWLQIISKYKEAEYDAIDTLLPEQLLHSFNQERFWGMKLESLFYLDDEEQYSKILSTSKKLFPNGTYIQVSEFMYIEKYEGPERAEQYMLDVNGYERNLILIQELYNFYRRNLINSKRNQVAKKIIVSDRFLPNFRLLILKSEIKILFDSGLFYDMYKTCEYGRNNIDSSDFEELLAECCYTIDDYRTSSVTYENLYEKTSNVNYLYKSMVSYFKLNDMNKVIEIIKLLLDIDIEKKTHYLIVLSNAYLLNGMVEESYEAIKEALLLNEDNPKSEAHFSFVDRTRRIGKKDEFGYVYEYSTKYPTHDDWLKQFKTIEQNDDGSEVLSEEAKKLFESISDKFTKALYDYKNGTTSYSVLNKQYGLNFITQLCWRDIYHLPIWCFNGNVKRLEKEIETVNTKFAFDSGSLYMIWELGLQDLLEDFEAIYLTDKVVEDIQRAYLHEENGLVKEILDYIYISKRITYLTKVNVKSNALSDNIKDIYHDNQIDIISKLRADICYVYSDGFVAYVDNLVEGVTAISVPSFLKVLCKMEKIDGERLSYLLFNLKKLKYEFISFSGRELYEIFTLNDFEFTAEFIEFITIKKRHDITSMMRVYKDFVELLAEKPEKQFQAIKHMSELANSLYNKKKHYINLLMLKLPKYSKQFEKIINSKSLLEITEGFAEIFVMDTLSFDNRGDAGADYIQITSQKEYKRFMEIVVGCTLPIIMAIELYKHDESLLSEKTSTLKEIYTNITDEDIDRLVQLVQTNEHKDSSDDIHS